METSNSFLSDLEFDSLFFFQNSTSRPALPPCLVRVSASAKMKEEETRAAWQSGALVVTERIRPVLEAALAANDSCDSENQRNGLQQVRGEVEHVLSCLKEREESERSQSGSPVQDALGIRAATLMRCCQIVR